MEKPWTQAHVREGHACLLEAAAAAARRGAYADAENVARGALRDATSEDRLIDALGYVDIRGDAAEAILRRVRALAEGRLVRETFYRGVTHHDDHGKARDEAVRCGVPVVRITRIRRAK